MKDKVKLFESVIIVEDETGNIEFGTKYNQEFLEHMGVDMQSLNNKLIVIYEELLEEINRVNG